MILADTSVWVDHLRKTDRTLARLLDSAQVLVHPFIIGELALGVLRQREPILTALQDLPRAVVATEQEVLQFVDQHALPGSGIGYVDVHLLAATSLTPEAALWTRDRRLREIAERLCVAASSA